MYRTKLQARWAKLADGADTHGMSRPELFRAVVRGDVVGSHLVKPGKIKGIWLVNLDSLDDYIRSFLPGGRRFQKQALREPEKGGTDQ